MIVYYIMNYLQFVINYKSNFIIRNGSASLNPSLIPSLNPSLNETPLAWSHPKISPVKCVNGTVKTVNAIHGRGGVISLKCPNLCAVIIGNAVRHKE